MLLELHAEEVQNGVKGILIGRKLECKDRKFTEESYSKYKNVS